MCWAQITQDLSTKWKLINSNLAKIQKINLRLVDLYFDPEDMSTIMQTTVTEVLWPLESLNLK